MTSVDARKRRLEKRAELRNLLLHPCVEDQDGVVHRGQYPGSIKRVGMPVRRRATICFRRVKGRLLMPNAVLSCLECMDAETEE